jgi:hypothetical protein
MLGSTGLLNNMDIRELPALVPQDGFNRTLQVVLDELNYRINNIKNMLHTGRYPDTDMGRSGGSRQHRVLA